MDMYRPRWPDTLIYIIAGFFCCLLALLATAHAGAPPYWAGFLAGLSGAGLTCFFIADHTILNMRLELGRLRRRVRELSPLTTSSEGPTCSFAGNETIKPPPSPWSDRVYRCTYNLPALCS